MSRSERVHEVAANLKPEPYSAAQNPWHVLIGGTVTRGQLITRAVSVLTCAPCIHAAHRTLQPSGWASIGFISLRIRSFCEEGTRTFRLQTRWALFLLDDQNLLAQELCSAEICTFKVMAPCSCGWYDKRFGVTNCLHLQIIPTCTLVS